ncbi:hypothetical protein [Sorangium sp. So ce341]|uniref:hypothetical protein n=1 Tax=Sorangium sp. So ce341 TaxID=3133302 RepID=UPI003F5DCADE
MSSGGQSLCELIRQSPLEPRGAGAPGDAGPWGVWYKQTVAMTGQRASHLDRSGERRPA